MQPLARIAAEDGYASLLIDLPGAGQRYRAMPKFENADQIADYVRTDFVQSVVDLRRGLDYLQSRKDIDSSNFGLIGLSLGGFIGVDLAGVDPRIKSVALISAGGGLPAILSFQAEHKVIFGGADYTTIIRSADMQRLDGELASVDPINYVARIAPRPILMENGASDQIVPPPAAQNLYDRAGQPKSIDWYAGEGHTPSPLGIYASLTVFLHQRLPIKAASRVTSLSTPQVTQ